MFQQDPYKISINYKLTWAYTNLEIEAALSHKQIAIFHLSLLCGVLDVTCLNGARLPFNQRKKKNTLLSDT